MNSQLVYRRPSSLEGVELLHCMDRDFKLAPHVHDAYVFWFNGLGGDVVSLAGSTDILQPDSFGVVAPGEVHANHAVTEERTLHSMYVDASVIEDVAAQFGSSGYQFRSRLHRDPQARRALANLHSALMDESDTFLGTETFYRVFGFLLERHGEDVTPSSLRRDPAKVRLARSIMNEQFGSSLDINELAHLCGCSACHLIRLFRRETGMTPHAYLMEVRLCHARSLLAGSNPISEIAFDAGFTDQSHLTRRFRARYGLTPAEYRRQISS